MPLLTDLPPELLHAVFEKLVPRGPATTHTTRGWREIIINSDFLRSRSCLGRMTRVCRKLHGISQAYLYRVVLIKDHLELLLLFRTLATTPRLRSLVRSFFWACQLSIDVGVYWSDPETLYHVLPHLEQSARDCWTAVAAVWPVTQDDILLYRLYLLTGPDRLVSWSLLGAVLGMISNVRQLYLAMSSFRRVSPRGDGNIFPEHQCLERLLDPRGHGWASEHWPVIDNLHEPEIRPGPFTNWSVVKTDRFLQHVESVTLDPTSVGSLGLAEMTMGTLRFLLGTSKRIRRFELRGIPHWGVLTNQSQLVSETFVAENIRHFTLLHGMQMSLLLESLVWSLPNLESLHLTHFFLSNGTISIGIDVACRALVKLAPTLRRLEWMSSCRDDAPRGSFEHLDHSGTPVLAGVVGYLHKLQHFATEAIWLFSRDHPETAFELGYMLPPSLESFHLVDVWGPVVSRDAPYQPFYHPEFPGGATPLEYFDRVLGSLRGGCAERNFKLSDIKLTSPLFAGDLGNSFEVRQFKETYTRAFRHMGRTITFAVPSDLVGHEHEHDQWANVLP